MDNLLKEIDHWNENRVPILRISKPTNRNQPFKGVMRFYFQDADQRVATKCISISSNDTVKDVINVLIEKFRPDMKMLSVAEYGLYEIHENGEERKLLPHDKPLLVQLEWNKDDREGRFLLRRMDEKTRELTEEPSLCKSIASKLYRELPETSFTRSISNPEAVMKRRRAQKLERRLQDANGTLRIFGEALNKDVSYKTLLLSIKHTASQVVEMILEKYGKENENPSNYCLVQLIVPPTVASGDGSNLSQNSTILDDDDRPMLINQNHDSSRGVLTFHIKRKPPNYIPRNKSEPSIMMPNAYNTMPLDLDKLHRSSHVQQPPPPPLQHQPVQSFQQNNPTNPQPLRSVQSPGQILPALIQVEENVEDIFLSHVITIKPTDVNFRLAPTYVLYMVSRYRASTLFRPELQAPARAELFVPFTRKIASMIKRAIEVRTNDSLHLTFWLANSSDLCYFYKQDKHLSHFTLEAKEILYSSIKLAFMCLRECKQEELKAAFAIPQLGGNLEQVINKVLFILDETMATMKKCRVNAAIAIQILSYLFHHISKSLYNLYKCYMQYEMIHIMIQKWSRLIRSWAEKQGLEQAADYHLCRVSDLIQNRSAYGMDEELEFNMPLLIPEDGYSSETIRYVPNGLLEFVGYLTSIQVEGRELCIFIMQQASSGYWTIYFENHQQEVPEVIDIQLRKIDNSIGLSITALKAPVQPSSYGIYIRSVVKHGAAWLDGRLQAGDQILEVDGISLINISEKKAAEIMNKTCAIVTLRVAKQAAVFQNLMHVINPPEEVNQTFTPPQSNRIQQSLIDIPPPTLEPPQEFKPQVPNFSFAQVPAPIPKKVSWVDSQPLQSLHTLIPPSPGSMYTDEYENGEKHYEDDEEVPNDFTNYINNNNTNNSNNNSNHNHHHKQNIDLTFDNDINQEHQQQHQILNIINVSGNSNDNSFQVMNDNSYQLNSVNENNNFEIDNNNDSHLNNQNSTYNTNTNSNNSNNNNVDVSNNDSTSAGNGTLDNTLTLEDIDDVLGARSGGNWFEDSAGVIGTQEVYNDPRQRIVREKQQKSSIDPLNNTEGLSLKQKIRLFEKC